MRGNRPSSLDVALLCPAAPRLSTGGAGRSAFISSVFHAKGAGDPSWEERYLQLTERERQDFDSRMLPTDVTLPDGRVLRYADAHKEVRWGLTDSLEGIDPADDPPELLTAGTIDAHWDPIDGITYVADLKGSEYTSHPDSQQLHCYGHMAMALTGARGYCTGIWACREGTWNWGRLVEPDSDFDYPEIRERLLLAITNTQGPAVTGQHCLGCWSKHRCTEWLLPAAALTGTPLEPFVDPETMSNEQAFDALLMIKRLELLTDRMGLILKGWARENGGIHDPISGKVWREINVSGRMRFDKEGLQLEISRLLDRLKETGLDATLRDAGMNPDAIELTRFQNRGPASTRVDWVNAHGAAPKRKGRK